ncbi:hypothetical protein PGQ11_003045 [Apiospora arundinis]|uniref:Uncharacterized protein n=1 Tax=Apiospora arundinis TaxID=335852 RepID=A0ABR2J4S1_9PEZI
MHAQDLISYGWVLRVVLEAGGQDLTILLCCRGIGQAEPSMKCLGASLCICASGKIMNTDTHACRRSAPSAVRLGLQVDGARDHIARWSLSMSYGGRAMLNLSLRAR